MAPVLLILVLFVTSPLFAQSYDLLLKGGHVIDPANQIDQPMDVAISGDTIARVAPEIPVSQASKSIDIRGFYVTPGLIDIHAHHYGYGGAIFPDDSALSAGTTTTVDCGGPGWRNFEDFKEKIVDRAQTRVLAFINIVGHGMLGSDYENNVEDMDPKATAAKIKQYPGLIVGIKNAHFALPGFVSVERAIEAGKLSNTPVILDNSILSWTERDTRTKVLEIMRPGDLHTHSYNDRHVELLNRRTGEIQPFVKEARKRGVLFDLGHGGGSFVWPVAVGAMKNGFPPDTISTDLHASSIMGSESDMPNCMSKLINLGMPLKEAVERSTVRPAQILRRFPELGTLGAGKVADIAVLRLDRGAFSFNDAWGKKLTGEHKLTNVLTIRAGKIVYDRNGISFPEWDEAERFRASSIRIPHADSISGEPIDFEGSQNGIWEILFKGGHLIDPFNERNGRMDVAVAGNRIVRVGKNLPVARARLVVPLDGYYLTPGLIDLNAHVDTPGAWHNLNTDHNALRFGVTTVVDAGNSGWETFEDFKSKVIDRARTRVLAFLNIAPSGSREKGESNREFDPAATSRIARKFSEIIVGIQASFSQVGQSGMEQAIQAARGAEVPLMASFPREQPAPDLLNSLQAGDMVTGIYGEKAFLMDETGTIRPAIAEARRKGVLFDLGHGSSNFRFPTAAAAIRLNFLPDTISTAMDKASIMIPRTEMMTTFSKLLNLGVPLEELISRATVAPARAINRPELGTLSEGAIADLAVLQLEEGDFGFVDSAGLRFPARHRLKAVLTVRNGRIVWDTAGLSRTEWSNVGPYSNYR